MTLNRTLPALAIALVAGFAGTAAMATCESPNIPMGTYTDANNNDPLDRVELQYLCLGSSIQYRMRIVADRSDWGLYIGGVTGNQIDLGINRGAQYLDVNVARMGGDRIRVTVDTYEGRALQGTEVSVLDRS